MLSCNLNIHLNTNQACRYANMDYIFFSSATKNDYVRLVMSYDIVCQWWINLWLRMTAMPYNLQIDCERKLFIFLILKFHLPAHIAKCHTSYSFNFTRSVGQTEGEAPERGWSNINPVSSSTKQMGPASYRETIDDHFGDWNHQRIIRFGKFWYTIFLIEYGSRFIRFIITAQT